MKPEDNIKKFFEKRLQDNTPGDDLWNVPSDDIWDSAKVHFPKKEKKRRPFIFFILGVGLLALVSIGIGFYINGKMDNSKELVEKEMKLERIDVGGDENKNENENTNVSSAKNQNQNQNENETQNQNAGVNSTKNLWLNDRQIGQKNQNETQKSSSNVKENQAMKIKEVTFVDVAPSELDEMLIDEKTGIEKEELIPALNERPVSEKQRDIVEIEKPISNLKIEIENYEAVSTIPGVLSLLEVEKEIEDLEMDYKIIKPKRKLHKWEAGLSHSPFILNIRKGLTDTEDQEPNEKVSVDFKYRNINVPITRWFNKKWSMTSGISLSSIDLKLDFEVEEVYAMVPTDAELREVLDDNTPSGELTVNDISREIGIVFVNDADLQDGDTLSFQGNVPIKLNVIQVPILLNYHFGKGKLEGLIHTGFAIDYFKTEVQNLNFDIYKNERLISEPVTFDPINEHELDFSLYFGVGVKYHISDRLNIGLSTKLDFTGLILSRHEIGLYYGF